MKVEHQYPSGLLDEIQMSISMLEYVNIDFEVGLRRTRKQYDAIWVVVDGLTKSAHFIPLKYTYSTEYSATISIEK